MTRREDWPEKLAEFLESHRNAEFLWGSLDCALFACDAVLAMTGIDMAVGFRGKYDSPSTAESALRDFSGGDLLDTADKIAYLYDLDEVPVTFAQRGDVVLLHLDSGLTLAIVGMDGTHAVTMGISGLVAIPMASAIRAWRI